jgi:NAD-dependent deacetylase
MRIHFVTPACGKINAMIPACLEAAREILDRCSRIVVLTGAGVSTDSGIPDFRGPRGVWTLNPKAERMSDIRYYVSDPEVRRLSWQSRAAHPAWTAAPNDGHRAIADLERQGRLHALITQNIDGLHQRAGSGADRVIEVHGTIHRVVCLACGWKAPMAQVLERVRAGEDDPPCPTCGGILKSDTISFGQALVPEVIDRALRVAQEADCLVAAGSTLQVYPVAAAVPAARRAGARLIIVNAEPTRFDDIADFVLTGSTSVVLPLLFGTALPSS